MSRYSTEQVEKLRRDWQQSGLTRKEFAESQGLSVLTFYYLLRRSDSKQEKSSPSSFQLLPISHSSSPPPEGNRILIRFPSGAEVEIQGMAEVEIQGMADVEMIRCLVR